jgi:hypothetical protein
MECAVIRASLLAAVLLTLSPAVAAAQSAPPAEKPPTRFWLVAGVASTTFLGDCTDCEAKTYLTSPSVLTTIGGSLNRRVDMGAEITWVPVGAPNGEKLYASFLMGKAQFRPWASRGFFLNAAYGMAFLRNYIFSPPDDRRANRSKALALSIGTGWEWRVGARTGVQAFATQHAAALGDLETTAGTAEDVLGNFWSIGAAIVIR